MLPMQNGRECDGRQPEYYQYRNQAAQSLANSGRCICRRKKVHEAVSRELADPNRSRASY